MGVPESTALRFFRAMGIVGVAFADLSTSGLTESCGPAVFDSENVLSWLTRLAVTEGAVVFVTRDGKLAFHKLPAPNGAELTFADTDANGVPYQEIVMPYSLDRLTNEVVGRRDGSDSELVVRDDDLYDELGPMTLTVQSMANSPEKVREIGQRILDLSGDPRTTFREVKVTPRYPTVTSDDVDDLLALDIGNQVEVFSEPPGPGDPLTQDAFIEHISHELVANANTWDIRFGLYEIPPE